MIIGIASADYVRADDNISFKEGWGGSGFVRIGQYLPFMRAAGHTVVAGVLQAHYSSTLADRHITHLEIEYAVGSTVAPDLILAQRLMLRNIDEAFIAARKAGQIVVSDVDDWYWGLSPENFAFKVTHPKNSPEENIVHYKRSISKSSYITASTPFLRDRVADFSGVPTSLIKNYVDVSRFKKVEITDTTTPEVGWVGSTLHRSGDLETMRGILAPMAARGDIKLVHAGDGDDAPSFRSKISAPDDIPIRTIPKCRTQDYPKLIDFETGIVPLRDTPFNEAKSELKGLEYSASGVPFVAGSLPSYDILHKDWTALGSAGFFVAKKSAHWIASINKLRDPSLRRDLQASVLENVKTRDISIGAKEFVGFLESCKPR